MNNKTIAIIPARGGSERIPGKNIRDFLGKPIIAYSIQAAKNCDLFDEVMVSTDNGEIAKVALHYGATVPFMRSNKNSDDYATTEDVLAEVLESYKLQNKHFDFACCLYPTAPLIQPLKIIEAYKLMIMNNFDAIFPLVRFSYPILRSLKITDGRVQMNWPEYLNSRSQDLPLAFHDSGQFYWMQINKFLKTNTILTENCGGIELSEMEVQDIDNETDWKLAIMKYKLSGK